MYAELSAADYVYRSLVCRAWHLYVKHRRNGGDTDKAGDIRAYRGGSV